MPRDSKRLGARAARLADPLDDLLADASDPAADEAPADVLRRRLRLSTEIDAEVLDAAKDAVFWTPGMTLAAFVTEALALQIQRLTDDRGEPFPPRTSALPPGRPVR
jgi:hypothetical protein